MLAVAVAASLLTAACGARTEPFVGTAAGPTGAGSGALAAGSPGGGVATDAGGLAPAAPGADTAAPVGAGGAPPAGATGAPGAVPGAGGAGGAAAGPASPKAAGVQGPPRAAGVTFDPAAQAAACPPAADRRASDVGVTPTSITMGNVSGLTGVLANNFNQGPEAVQALFSAINAHGGICGRQLKLTVQDDGQDASRNAASVADLAPKVFAFAGSTSSADNGGVQEMVRAGVPDVGFAINAIRGQAPVYWSAGGATLFIKDGRPHFWNTLEKAVRKYRPEVKRVAFLAYNIPISSDAAKQFAYVFRTHGFEICFTDYSISPATASLDQDVIQMKEAKCDGVYTTMDVTGNAKLLQAMQRQDFKPPFRATTFAGYAPVQISVAGEAASQGFEATLPFLPFEEKHPVTQQYLKQLATYQPGKQPSSFGFQAWSSAQMLVHALIKAGPNPTRAAVVKIFESLESWDTGGAASPTTPRLRRPSGPCNVQVVVKGKAYTRLWPAQGMECDGTLVPSA